jgi:hypothetical protein
MLDVSVLAEYLNVPDIEDDIRHHSINGDLISSVSGCIYTTGRSKADMEV